MDKERRFHRETAGCDGAALNLVPSSSPSGAVSGAMGRAAGGWLPPSGQYQNGILWRREKMGQVSDPTKQTPYARSPLPPHLDDYTGLLVGLPASTLVTPCSLVSFIHSFKDRHLLWCSFHGRGGDCVWRQILNSQRDTAYYFTGIKIAATQRKWRESHKSKQQVEPTWSEAQKSLP